jgi:allantoinase
MIDAHVHLQEPGREHWEGFDSGSAAAAAGGVTTVVDMPIDCHPPTVTAPAVVAKADSARRHSRVDVALWGGLIPDSVGALDAMADAGVIGFKAFGCPSGWDDFPAIDTPALRTGMAVAARRGLPVAMHCELAHLGHTIDSEVAAVAWAAGLAADAAAKLHVVHVSSAAAIDEARRWPGVTVETCLHYLLLDENDGAHCFPPIRDSDNRAALWDRVGSGLVDCLASDHSPCPPELKEGPSPWAGLEGVGLTLPLLLSTGRLALHDIARLTTAAGRLLRLPGKGSITAGADADLALVDPLTEWEVGPDTLWTRHRLSPFAGRAVCGRVVRTLVRGRTVFSSDNGPCPPGGALVLGPGLRPGPRPPTPSLRALRR